MIDVHGFETTPSIHVISKAWIFVQELAAAESYYEKLKPDCLDVPWL